MGLMGRMGRMGLMGFFAVRRLSYSFKTQAQYLGGLCTARPGEVFVGGGGSGTDEGTEGT